MTHFSDEQMVFKKNVPWSSQKIELKGHNNTLWWTNVLKKKRFHEVPKKELRAHKKKTLCSQQLK
jgi:hypothetical protein